MGIGLFVLPEGTKVSEEFMLMPNFVPQYQQLHRADLDQQQSQRKEGHILQCGSDANQAFLSLETKTYVILATLYPDKLYSWRC